MRLPRSVLKLFSYANSAGSLLGFCHRIVFPQIDGLLVP